MSDRLRFECERCRITILMPGPDEEDDGWSPKCLGCYVRMRRAESNSAFALNVGRELAAAIPVLEAAIGSADISDPDGAIAHAVRTFGGGGYDGIQLADGRLVEWRVMAMTWGRLVDLLRPLAEAGASEPVDGDPGWAVAREQRRVIRARHALRWFVGLDEIPPKLDQGDE